VMMPKKTSTRFSQEPDVGVKCSVILGCLARTLLNKSPGGARYGAVSRRD
jgi:hypothetical protein